LWSFNAGKTQEDFAADFPIATKINCRVAASASRLVDDRRHRSPFGTAAQRFTTDTHCCSI
jgi:hypothetical protein